MNKIPSAALRVWLASCLLLAVLTVSAQKTVTGKVVDQNSQPVSNASVLVKGTSTGTTTGTDGTFSIAVPAGQNTLVISSVGFEDMEVNVANRSSVDVSLQSRADDLSEVVVTGYSTQRKKDIIGAVSVVDIEDLKATPAANLGAQLQGRATGVTVSGNGAPGSPAVVRIRGFQSGGNNDPLYVIDGVPTSDPSNINPQDISSMQILKDGTASAIYGTRAANGVVIITTKQGRAGRTVVSYDGYVGVQKVTDNMIPAMLDNQEYIEYLTRINYGTHRVFGAQGSYKVPDFIIVSDALKGGVSASNPAANPDNYSIAGNFNQILQPTQSGTNWFNEILQPGLMQSHQISASGGGEKGTYSMGLNYFDQEGTIIKTGFKRYLVRFNSNLKPTSWLTLGENVQVSYTDSKGGQQRGEGGAWSWAYRMVPYIPVYDIKGGFGGNGVGESGNGSNPVANLIRDQDDKNLTTRLFGNVYAEIKPVEWATIRTSFGTDVFNTFQKDISRRTYERSENQGTTQLTERSIQGLDWTWTNTLTLQKSFGEHDVKVLLGTEAIRRYYKQTFAFGQRFDLDNADFISLSNAGTASGDRNVGQEALSTVTIFSKFGRLDYAYADKYLLNGTLRYDESSVFGAAVRGALFPSVGFGWRISEESFMKNTTWLTDLKLRGGVGQVGSISNNGALNPFTTFRTGPGFGNYDLNGTNTSALLGYRQNTLGNDSTKWENTISKNIGLDMTILNGKWTLDLNFYRNDTRDLLLPRNRIPTEPIVTQPNVNIGDMRNTGYEIGITNRGTITGDLTYDATVTFSHYKNVLVRLNEEGNPNFYGLDRFSNAVKIDAGLPISTYWGYQIVGFYNTQSDVDKGPTLVGQPAKIGTWKYLDRNGDGNITSADAGVIGNPHPKFQMGFNLNLNYHAFDFSTFLFWNYGNDIYNYTKWYTDMRGFVGGVSDRVLYDSWSPNNQNAKLPLLQDGFNVPGNFVAGESNSYYVEKGSYLRAKTMQLGYTIPGRVMSNIKLQGARLYVQALNLFTITKYTGADPDLSVQRAQRNAGSAGDYILGVDQSGFPNPKQFMVGLNVTF